MSLMIQSPRRCNNRCIICHGYATHQQLQVHTSTDDVKGKISPSLMNAKKNASRWKRLSMESFSMLFGLPVNHKLVTALFIEDVVGGNCGGGGKLCNRCFEDVNDVHYVFWQLHNLESKLIQLQNLIFERLRENYNGALVTNDNSKVESNVQGEVRVESSLQSPDEIFRILFQEILLKKEKWPKETYVSRWKEAEKFVHQNLENLSNTRRNSDLIIRNTTKVKVELRFECDQHEVEQFSSEKTDEEDNGDNISFDDDNISCDDDSDWNAEKSRRQKSGTKPAKSKTTKTSTKSTKTMTDEGVLRRFLCTADSNICSRTYGRKKDLTKHIKQFHSGRKYVCDIGGCVEKFLSAKSLEWHKIRDHDIERERKFVCTVDPDVCNREYCKRSDLNDHIKQFHDGRIYACQHEGCKEKFRTAVKLLSHQIKVHGYERKRLPNRICHICGESLSSKNWKEHFRNRHHGNLNSVCSRCYMNFETTEELDSHEKLHDQVYNTLPYTCVIGDCQTVFSNSLDLKNHVKIYHLTNWPKCEMCGIRKPNDVLLQIHIKTHQRQKTVFCDECPKSFYSEPALQDHKQDYHMGIKYTCETCGKEFTLKKSFIRHTRGHSAVKPHKCSICLKGFRSSQALRNHEAIHSGTKQFACQLCGKRFKQIQNLRQHLNTQQHKGQMADKLAAELSK